RSEFSRCLGHAPSPLSPGPSPINGSGEKAPPLQPRPHLLRTDAEGALERRGEIGGAAIAGDPRRLADAHPLLLQRLARLLQFALTLVFEQRRPLHRLKLPLQGAGAAARLVRDVL